MSDTPFCPPRWRRNTHVQTIWPVLLRKPPALARARERFELPDGDFVDLDWLDANPRQPLAIVLHGLSGSSDSIYVLGIQQVLNANRIGSVALNFRGSSGETNRLARSYHGGDTGDIAVLASALRDRFPQRKLFAIGYSIGANVLLKWLGETGVENPLTAACAVSVPFSLATCSEQLNRGFSKVYRNRLRDDLLANVERKRSALAKSERVDEFRKLQALGSLKGITTFRDYDNAVMAPLHGFRDADDYYARCSSAQFMRGIRVPTRVIHALDDPFMTPEVVPAASAISSSVDMQVSPFGGHVGFVGGGVGKPHYWLESGIPAFLRNYFGTD